MPMSSIKRGSTGTEVYGKMLDALASPSWSGKMPAVSQEAVVEDKDALGKVDDDASALSRSSSPHPGKRYTPPMKAVTKQQEDGEVAQPEPAATRQPAQHVNSTVTMTPPRSLSERPYAVDMMIHPLRAHAPSDQSSWLSTEEPGKANEDEVELARRINMYR